MWTVLHCIRKYIERMRAAREYRRERVRIVLRSVGEWMEEGKKEKMKLVLRCVCEYLEAKEWRRLRMRVVLRKVGNYLCEQHWREKAKEVVVEEEEEQEMDVVGVEKEPVQSERELSAEQRSMWDVVNSAIDRGPSLLMRKQLFSITYGRTQRPGGHRRNGLRSSAPRAHQTGAQPWKP